MCHDGGRCIEKHYVCDGNIHCKHGSDEKHCELSNCTNGFWKCPENKCIIEKAVCNGYDNCNDGSDEYRQLCAMWNCSENMFKCGSICISQGGICDGQRNQLCNGMDEDPKMCQQWNCTHGYWKCTDNSKCIAEKYVCVANKPRRSTICSDGSDEDPGHCASWKCSNDYWKCKNNLKCIRRIDVCNGVKMTERDCQDGSDEHPDVCLNWTCCHDFRNYRYYRKCKTGDLCLSESRIMNNKIDCRDGSDEDPLYLVGLPCHPSRQMCQNGKCVSRKLYCDGEDDCKDGSDEGLVCQNYKCLPNQWKCWDNSMCVDSSSVCDGYPNCKDGSDEHNTLCGCPDDESWPCKDGEGCITNNKVCDGYIHCNDTSDESDSVCTKWTCSVGLGKCHDNNMLCVPRCNGITDCQYGSDETNCDGFICLPGQRKCADNRQCVADEDICNDITNCRDASDEFCNAMCLPEYMNLECFIGRRCSEDKAICFPVEKFCDGVIDCPLGSDEADSDCTCEDWGLHECKLNGQMMCVYNEWIADGIIIDQFCEGTCNQHISKTKVLLSTEKQQPDNYAGKSLTRGILCTIFQRMVSKILVNPVFCYFYFSLDTSEFLNKCACTICPMVHKCPYFLIPGCKNASEEGQTDRQIFLFN